MPRKGTPTATIVEVADWLNTGIFHVKVDGSEVKVFKGDRELVQRENTRRNCHSRDARVDLCYNSKRRSCHVSHLVWMVNTGIPIPDGFEIHHQDENHKNNVFNNLICVHSLDHRKLHGETISNDTPF